MIEEEHVREELRLRTTDELVRILEERDEDEWRPEVFPLVEQVLHERGVPVPRARPGGGSQPGRSLPVTSAGPPEPQPVVVGRFDDDVETQLCRLALAQAGIEVRVRRSPDGPSAGGYELVVAEAQAEAAQRVLAAAESEAEAGEARGFRCPSCGFIAEPMREGSRSVCQVCGAAS